METDLCLNMTAGGCFTQKPMTEQVKFLENFMDRHTSSVIRTKPSKPKSCQIFLVFLSYFNFESKRYMLPLRGLPPSWL
jgi:hypothetical protein